MDCVIKQIDQLKQSPGSPSENGDRPLQPRPGCTDRDRTVQVTKHRPLGRSSRVNNVKLDFYFDWSN